MKNITLYFIIFIITLLIILGTNWFINMEDSKSLSKEFGFDSTNLLDMPYNDSTPKNKHVGVIGGGISGLSTAYYLLKEGYNVTLLESKQRVGGNNEAYIENGNMYPTSIVYYKPKQQPHHNKLCSELGIEHIRGEWEEGTIEFKDSYLTTSQTLSLIQTFTQFIKILTFQETIDFITIVILLRKEFLDSPDLKISVAECLGTRLINTEVFKDVIMGVVGVNCWCRLEDINEFPADIFAALIWEFSLPIRRRCNGIENVSILDGRIIDALEEANLKDSNYLQYLGKKVTYIEKTDNSNYNIYTSFNETYNFDLVVLTMQPRFANKIIKSSITHDPNINISNKLINELIKWDDTLECCTFIHNDNSRIKQGSFHYERIKITHNDEYTHFIQHAIPRDNRVLISYIYGKKNAIHFINNIIDNKKIKKILYPTLPIFKTNNTRERNKIWRDIDNDCKDIYWAGSCRTGVQFHNDGILSSKRVVSTILGKGW